MNKSRLQELNSSSNEDRVPGDLRDKYHWWGYAITLPNGGQLSGKVYGTQAQYVVDDVKRAAVADGILRPFTIEIYRRWTVADVVNQNMREVVP
jgi:hypothetical protein